MAEPVARRLPGALCCVEVLDLLSPIELRLVWRRAAVAPAVVALVERSAHARSRLALTSTAWAAGNLTRIRSPARAVAIRHRFGERKVVYLAGDLDPCAARSAPARCLTPAILSSMLPSARTFWLDGDPRCGRSLRRCGSSSTASTVCSSSRRRTDGSPRGDCDKARALLPQPVAAFGVGGVRRGLDLHALDEEGAADARIRCRASDSRRSLHPTSTTVIPSAARRRAIASPMPLVAPVTTALLVGTIPSSLR
jgi:hypothetical protein